MRTTVKSGRWGGARPGSGSTERSALGRARKLFAGLSRSLDGEIDRLQAALETETDEARAKRLNDMVRDNQKALQTVLTMEAKLMRESQKPRLGRDVIDLAEARAEIARRLDRLAGPGDAGDAAGQALAERAGGDAVAVGAVGPSAAPACA